VSRNRCPWAGSDPLMIAYHDREWGVPCFDDRRLFEMLVLEGAQAGLSWSTVLHKREGYRRAFAGFDPARVARFSAARCERLRDDAGIVRNRAKIAAAVTNAKAVLRVQQEHGGLADFLWEQVGGEPVRHRRRSAARVPAETAVSRVLSRELRSRGFCFVGPTICYAFMQAVGMVNDHLVSCFRQRELA